MKIKETLILDENEPLSKALNELLDTGTAVLITKNKKYTGIVDDRHLKLLNVPNPAKTKCKSVITKPSVLKPDTGILDQIDAFILGHYKALPVVDENRKPLGITTRVELLEDMKKAYLIPKVAIKTMMNSPVYVIDEKQTVAKAKNEMKKLGAKKLVVTRKGIPSGFFSTFDLTRETIKPNQRQRMSLISSNKGFDDRILSEICRPDVTTVPEKSTVEDAAKKMIDKGVSSVVILDGGEPVGVLSAFDIFKTIKQLAEKKVTVMITGLGKDTVMYRDMIRDDVQKAVDRFIESYGITDVRVHLKESKSVYTINIFAVGRKEYFTIHTVGPTVKDTLNMAVAELKKRLARKKRVKKSRKVLKKGGLQ